MNLFFRWSVYVTGILILAGLSIVTIKQVRARHQAEERVSHALFDQMRLEAELKRVKEQIRIEVERRLNSQTSLVDNPRPKSIEPPQPTLNVQERLDTDENVQLLKLKARRLSLDANYAPFFRMLNLSPSEIAAFKDAKLQREEEQQDLFATLRKQGLSLQDRAVGLFLEESETRYRQAQTAVLGLDGYQKLFEYDRTIALRQIVGGSIGSATADGVLFSPAQAEKLVQLMAQTIPEYQKGDAWADMANIDWEIVDAQAQEILSPEQFAAFRTLESHGPEYSGSRELTHFHTALRKAANSEKATARELKSAGG